MLSGDGLVARLRLSCNEAPLALVADIADWSEAYGNGALDLSQRGNLQIRGVSEASLPALSAQLARADLTEASAEAEAVRNVLVSPLAGFDPAAAFDVRPQAKALERELGGNRELWALPAKFGFAFNAGAYRLGEACADVVFVAVDPNSFLVSLGGETLGPFPEHEAVRLAVQLAQVFLTLRSAPDPPRRMRDAVRLYGVAPFAAATGLPRASQDIKPRPAILGPQPLGDLAFVGLALPFGRLPAADLRALGALAAQAGATVLRLTPWRAILVPGLTLPAARALAQATRGFILDPADPRLAVAACTGAPGCSSALGETRAAAARLAPLVAGEGIVLHVSGCAKGCAHPGPAPYTLVATAAGYDLIAGASPLARAVTLDEAAEFLKERAA